MRFHHVPLWGVVGFAAWVMGCSARGDGTSTDSDRIKIDTSDAQGLDDVESGETETSEGPDPLDPIWDSAVFWEVSPSVPDPTDGEACGVPLDGGPTFPCHLQLADDWVSTLCDEARGRCVAPTRDCRGGWCYIPPRSYLSGSGYDTATNRETTIAVVKRGFFIMQTAVTFGAFERLMGYLPDVDTRCGSDCPVGGTTAFEAMEFANRLSAHHGLEPCYELEGCRVEMADVSGGSIRTWTCAQARFPDVECEGYRFPSLREWELAVRAGSPFCLGRGPFDDIGYIYGDCSPHDPKHYAQRHAIYCGNSRSVTEACPSFGVDEEGHRFCRGPRAVRSTEPNDFGLYEAYGNQHEWLQTRGIDLPRGDVPKPPPPYPIDTNEEFWTEIDDSNTFERGATYVGNGRYDFPVIGQCGWGTGLLGTYTPRNLHSQFIGFRLVRLVPQ